MQDQIKLHTTDLPITLSREFYDDLVENFRLIEQTLNNLNSEVNSLNGNDAGISVTNSDGETSIIDISDTDTSSEIS